MRSPKDWWPIALAISIILSACAPSTQGPTETGAPKLLALPAPKTLTIALQGEPSNLMTLLGGDVGGSPARRIEDSVHQHLSTYTERGEVLPMAAAELPSQTKGTWILRSDGTMQTTYKLRSNATWHDGTPFTARDVLFAWTVSRDRDLPVASRGTSDLISRIEAPDDLTLVMEWPKPYPNADIVTDWSLGPLPAHLLEALYHADKEQFQRHLFWNREFVGLGPYSVAEWELGSHLTVKAYERFYAGRPRIDTVVFRFIPNEPTVVANLLAGTVDGQFRAISFNQVMVVKSEWERMGKKAVAIGQPTTWRVAEVQYRDAYRDPKLRELLDVRVRRGLLHAIDRTALVEHNYQGQAPVSDTFISPQDIKWDWVKDAIVRYEYDPRRAEQLLAEAGWHRAPGGSTLSSSGERVTIPFRTTEGGQWQDEMAIIADHWKAIGLNAEQQVIPTAQSRDRLLRATFPGISTTSQSLPLLSIMKSAYGPECATESIRWVGNNRGCYQNPEMDRLINTLSVAIDPSEQRRAARDLATTYTQELPGLPLYFTVQVIFFREGVVGVKGGARPDGTDTWNIHQWDVVN